MSLTNHTFWGLKKPRCFRLFGRSQNLTKPTTMDDVTLPRYYTPKDRKALKKRRGTLFFWEERGIIITLNKGSAISWGGIGQLGGWGALRLPSWYYQNFFRKWYLQNGSKWVSGLNSKPHQHELPTNRWLTLFWILVWICMMPFWRDFLMRKRLSVERLSMALLHAKPGKQIAQIKIGN